jgi:amino acid adenylation domain-containing protein/thioester reductase-like protein
VSDPAGRCWHAASVGQRGLWFEQQAEPASNAYNLACCVRFDGAIDPARLSAAIAALASRHPLMRARFALRDGALGWIEDGAPPACDAFAGIPEVQAQRRVADALLRPYDLERESPWRFVLAATVEGTTLFALGCHHIVSDLHSMAIVVTELEEAYSGRPLAQVPAPYDGFVAWQDERMGSGKGGEEASWWHGRWSAACPARIFPEAAEEGVDGRIDFAFEPRTVAAVGTLAKAAATTPFVVMLTAFQCVLARRAGQRAVVVGAPSSGRNDPRHAGTVGYLVNLLPLTLVLRLGEPVLALIERNARDVRDALRHGQYPFGAMMRDLQHSGSPDAARRLQATFTFQKTRGGLEEPLAKLALGLPGGGLRLGGMTGAIVRLSDTRAQFPLGIAVAPTSEGFVGSLTWQGTSLDRVAAEDILRQWTAFIDEAAATPQGPADLGASGEATLAQELDAAFARFAARPAVSTESGALTYGEVGTHADAICSRLQALDVCPGDRVAVVGLGGSQTISAFVGVLRSGAAFLPVDGDVDKARLEAILRQARVKAIVACDGVSIRHDPGVPVLEANTPSAVVPVPAAVTPLDLAWLMSTSGTTGAPKLAVVPHEAAAAHARAIVDRFGLCESDRVLQFASLGFDEHAEEIFPTLLAGACIVCRPRVRFEDPETLLAYVQAHGVSVLHLPTSYWHLWMDEAASRAIAFPAALRLVNAGGEQASAARLRTWARQAPRRTRWFNTYGLTEAAVTSLAYEAPRDGARVESMARIPAGQPLSGTRVRIVRDDGTDSAAEESGELWLGGAGVGLGYFDNTEATEARFSIVDGVRWLRTGDLAYRDRSGDVVVTGRRDRAIKLRGQRLDLGDVEGALGRHPALLECVVAATGDGLSSEGLELYAALRPGHAASESDLLDFWREALPGTPAPRRVAFCAAIPRTAGRKPDLRALRTGLVARAALPVAREHDAAHDAVAATFAQLLQREGVDATASFFSLGGDSLLAMRLVASVRAALGVELSIADFLGAPTVEGIAAICRARTVTAAAPPRLTASDGERYALSRAQARAWTMARAAGGDARVSLRFAIAHGVDEARLARAWTRVVARHRLLGADIGEAGNLEHSAPDLAQCVAIQQGNGGRRYWTVRGSLLTLDGSAVSVLLRDLASAYARDDASGLVAVSYRRFVEAEAAWLASPSRPAARAYWEDRLRGLDGATRPFRDRTENAGDFSTRRVRLALGSNTRRRVLALAESLRCTPFHVLLAAFASLAGRFAASDDVLIGVPVSLREVLGAGEVVGPTLNAVPFRMRLTAGEPFSAQVQRTRDLVVRSLAHAALPHEEILACCPALAASRGTALPLQFVAQDAGVVLPDRSPLLEEAFEREGRGPADLLVGVRIGERIALHFEYRRAVLDDAAAVAWARAYRTLLASLLDDPDAKACSARLLARSDVERRVRARPAASGPGNAMLLHRTLEDGARATPGRVALVDGERRLDYAALDRLANRHAARLVAAGVAPGDLVAVDSRKGAEEIVATLAILKAGAAYVPIATDMPVARAESLLARSGARVLTGAEGGRPHPAFVGVDMSEGPAVPPPRDIATQPSDTAYVLFTSGSTGEPKAVEVSHRAALLTVHEVLRRFGIGHDDVLYGLSALDFDLSVFDVFGAFAARATLVLPSSQAGADAFAWVRDVARHGVTVWNTVPSSLDMLLEATGHTRLPSLRRLLLSGDWVGLGLPDRARAACPGAMFVALGGATEAAIWSNCQVVESVDPRWRSIPYGRALNGHSMFVAESSGWPAPSGATGEILIGGGGLAKGYRGAPELTAERFVAHPIAGERVYRTGDLGRYLADGTIEFLGRVDRQVKVHGFRIEVAEVEAAFASTPGVERVLVNPVGIGRGKTYDGLAAFVVPLRGAAVDLDALRRIAEERLPRYMRPTAWCVAEAIPLTANGKVDRAALTLPANAAAQLSEAAVDRSFTGMERRIALLWHELLPHRAPRRDEDFFSAGGHSLLAVRLLARVRDDTGVEVSLPQWLREPTLANLARKVEQPASDFRGTRHASITDLERHVRLADDIRFNAERPRGASILVTGAAGLIGRRLVGHLARQGGHEILCLVRPGSASRAPVAAGVRIVEGDLALPRFGLSEPLFESLARRVGAIFHVGATVNLVAGYEALEAANVGGTHEAIRLAALGNATLHHVSSVGVLPYGAGRRVLETDSIEVDGALMTGYCESKWVAERLVRMAMQRGLRATIHRPGLTIAGDAKREDGVLECVLALATQVRALPSLDMPIDVVSADYVAEAIATIAGEARALGGTFHLTHPRPVQMAALARRVAATFGLAIEPFEAWQARLASVQARIEDPRCAALAALILSHDAASIAPASIDCRGAVRALGGRVNCPSVLDLLATFFPASVASA